MIFYIAAYSLSFFFAVLLRKNKVDTSVILFNKYTDKIAGIVLSVIILYTLAFFIFHISIIGLHTNFLFYVLPTIWLDIALISSVPTSTKTILHKTYFVFRRVVSSIIAFAILIAAFLWFIIAPFQEYSPYVGALWQGLCNWPVISHVNVFDSYYIQSVDGEVNIYKKYLFVKQKLDIRDKNGSPVQTNEYISILAENENELQGLTHKIGSDTIIIGQFRPQNIIRNTTDITTSDARNKPEDVAMGILATRNSKGTCISFMRGTTTGYRFCENE